MTRPALAARALGANARRLVRRAASRFWLPREGFWVRLRLARPLEELAVPSLWMREPGLAFLEVLELLGRASADPHVDGVLLELGAEGHGLAKISALRRALRSVREAGKPVVVFAERLGAEGLLLASAASRIFLPPAGSVFLVGLRIEAYFLRDLLEKIGVEPEVIREGAYKSVAETFTRRGMSPQQREQLEALLDDHWSALVEGIAEGRGLGADRVRELADGGPYATREACEAGLVDAALFADELEPVLEQLAAAPPPERAGPRRVRIVEAPVYHWFLRGDSGWRPLGTAWPRVAYLVASGAIHRGGGLRGVGAETYRQLLGRLRRDEAVRAVVLRIDSPGGDGLASDLLWRELRRLGREKPVVASLGGVAASGGYYLAAAADAILAEAGTVTGSIGVVAGKLNLAGLYRHLGVATEAVERGARAGLLSEARGLTPEERAALRGEVASHYELFLERVCEGRGRRREEIDAVARGRIWSGVRARAAGLVDALGGPLEALAEARRRAGLGPDEAVQLDVLPSLPRLPSLRRLLPGGFSTGLD